MNKERNRSTMINKISFKKGNIAIQILVIVLFRWTNIVCQLNLHDTDQRFEHHSLQSDCLKCHVRRETFAYHELSDVVDELISYCHRPATDWHESIEDFDDILSQKLTFEQLRVDNIDSLQLLSWSMPIEVAERYQFYLSQSDSVLNEQIYNCTSPRFGLWCQYSFESAQGMSFNEIVEADFHGRTPYIDSSDIIVQIPCYVLLECHRDGQPWCLDWREICDGNVDCFDDGLDEEFCFEMEVNECTDEEYRCHNGLCISQELWEDGAGDTDCLDRSDKSMDTSYIGFCFQDPTFRCEEHSCRADVNPFSCGDGQCVSKLRNCHNGRHVSLIESMTVQGDLTKACWTAMICLTGLGKKVNETICNVWLRNESAIHEGLEQCESLFQFPTVPVQFQVYFLYKDLPLRINLGKGLMPDYICYNEELCDSFTPDFFHGDHACLDATELIFTLDSIRNTWDELMLLIGERFRLCSTFYPTSQEEINYAAYPSLYNCENSLKWISKHRILDEIIDCFKEDDENFNKSCELNDRYRVTCLDQTKCWSPLVRSEACLLNDVTDPDKVQFSTFCDRIETYYHDSNGRNYSDEYGCGDWSCDNIYTRCDGFWSCDDGRDEQNCGRTKCIAGTFACISPDDYKVFCLNSSRVNDKVVDCLGALDEQTKCRHAFDPLGNILYRFRCSDEQRCLSVAQLCDNEKSCSDGGDEDEGFCRNQQFECEQSSTHNRSEIEEVICGLNEERNHSIKHFSVRTSSNYPLLEGNHVNEFIHRGAERRFLMNNKPLQSHPWPWHCHRGLILHTWTTNNTSHRVCRCPPSYYGHLCQYQNQRISLTLRLTSNDRDATYAIVSMLIDNTDEEEEIHAYDQSIYIAKQSCTMKFNRYLLFPTRPKDISKYYTVRIDVFEKNTLTYIGSWHFPISFLFLPVNRLSLALNLSNHLLHHSSNCSSQCINGECMKYVNKPESFCRCFPQWSDRQCNTSLNCETCSLDSICIGRVKNQTICVCPINKFGPRCLLTSTCPINACRNNGRCVPADMSIPGNSYTCLCSDLFFGPNCDHRKATLDVSLKDIDIPPYVVAYFYTLFNRSDPIETTILRKLTLFQYIVTFHIAVAFQLTFIQANDKYYLAALQQSPKTGIESSISPTQECLPFERLVNSTIVTMIEYQRIIYFHRLCQSNFNLTCFIDKVYLCLCTTDHLANCMKFNHPRQFTCPWNDYCANGGQCLQDHPTCPSTKICLCPNCFFGNRCQFYAKGLGSTLDEILGYEFKRNRTLFQQPSTVIIGAVVLTIISFVGIVNSILSMIVFLRKKSREVGCGIYLLASSITSLIIAILLLLKFWFLFYSHQDHHGQRHILKGNCFGIEPLLKLFLYLGTWLNACVAIERTISVIQRTKFDRKRSRKMAKWIIGSLLLIIGCLFIPQLIHLHIFYDESEERSWCVIRYVEWLATYSSVLIFVHYFAPLAINIFSIVCLILLIARRQSRHHTDRAFWTHIRSSIWKHKHILISSMIIICLTLPHLIISIILDCQKSSKLFWFYQIGYFLSFLPAAFIFVIFVLPSKLFREEFNQFIIDVRKRLIRHSR